MSFLKYKIDYSKPRKVIGDIEINHYTKKQEEELVELVRKQIVVETKEEKITIKPNNDIDDINIVRYLFENLTNKCDEIKTIDDDELINILNDADFILKQVIDEFFYIIQEIIYNIKNETTKQIYSFVNLIDQNSTLNSLDDISKKLGIDIKDLLKMGQLEGVVSDLEKKRDRSKTKKGVK